MEKLTSLAKLNNVNPQPLYQIIILHTPELCMRNLPLNWKISTDFFSQNQKKRKKNCFNFIEKPFLFLYLAIKAKKNLEEHFSLKARKITSEASKPLKALRKLLS